MSDHDRGGTRWWSSARPLSGRRATSSEPPYTSVASKGPYDPHEKSCSSYEEMADELIAHASIRERGQPPRSKIFDGFWGGLWFVHQDEDALRTGAWRLLRIRARTRRHDRRGGRAARQRPDVMHPRMFSTVVA